MILFYFFAHPLELYTYSATHTRCLENSRSKELIYSFSFISFLHAKRSHSFTFLKTETFCIFSLSSRYVAPPLCSKPFCECSSTYFLQPKLRFIFRASSPHPIFLLITCLLSLFHLSPQIHTCACTHTYTHTLSALLLSKTQRGAHLLSPPTPPPLIAPLARCPCSHPLVVEPDPQNLKASYQILSTEALTDTQRPRQLSAQTVFFSLSSGLTLLSYTLSLSSLSLPLFQFLLVPLHPKSK